MSIRVTEAAAARVAKILAGEQPPTLRLGVRKSGCSGYAYVVEPAQDVTADDLIFEDKGVRLVVAADSLPFLDGTELDFRKEGLSEAFKFNNPNVKDACGCGESFTV
jgi:iron-sulfur cluster assembly protein